MRTSRPGAALVMALLAIIVLDCIVLGMLHIALQEHRIGANRAAVLQLRLDAESGARRALGLWSEEVDSMTPATGLRAVLPHAGTAPAQVAVERIDHHLFLFESIAAEPPPRVGRAAARLLVSPPALPPGQDASRVPIFSTGPVHVTTTGAVVAHPVTACAAPAPSFSVLAPIAAVMIDPGASVFLPVGTLGPTPLLHSFSRVAALAPHVLTDTDTVIATDAAGMLLVRGNVLISGGTRFRGLIIASGSVKIAAGADAHGAVHAAAGVTVEGLMQWDPCVADSAIRSAALDRPRPAGARAWLPAF